LRRFDNLLSIIKRTGFTKTPIPVFFVWAGLPIALALLTSLAKFSYSPSLLNGVLGLFGDLAPTYRSPTNAEMSNQR
jgi:hypothetical protein